MRLAALLLLVAPFLVPVWIFIDSKKRLGHYSWGWVLFAALTLFGLAGQAKDTLQARSGSNEATGTLASLIGMVAAGYFFTFGFYRAATGGKKKVENETAESASGREEEEKKTTTHYSATMSRNDVRKTIEYPSGVATKKCPKCVEEIKLEALVCRYCKHEFDEVDVQKTIKEFEARPGTEEFPRPLKECPECTMFNAFDAVKCYCGHQFRL